MTKDFVFDFQWKLNYIICILKGKLVQVIFRVFCLLFFNCISSQTYCQTMINRAITVAGGNPWGDASNTFNYPFGNFVDKAGNVYVADYNNHRIQKWPPGATSGTTVAGGNGYGSGGNQLAYPYDVFVDDNGVIYVSDAGNYRVQAWFPGAVNGITVAGGNGYGAASNQISPRGIWVDKSGNIYVADMYNNRIQMWIPGMGTGITVAGGNGEGSASNQLNAPTGIYIDNEGEIYVTDNGNHRVQKWTLGALTGITVAGGNGQGAAANQLYLPEESFLDSQGNLIIIDRSNKRIQKWEQNATSGTTIWGALAFGYIVSQLTNPTGIFIDECDHIYLTALGGDNAIKKLIKVPAIVASGPATFCTGDSVTLTTSQGTYLWNNNETGQSITVKSSGEYFVTVIDLKGCSSVSDKVIVKEVPPPPTPAITAAGSTSLCNGSTVMLSSSGTDIKWYKNGKLWSTGNNLTVSLEGNYTAKSFVVCESPPSNIISVTRGYTPSPPVITATGSTTLCNGSTVTLTSTGSGIVWSNGQTGNTITVSTAGNYTATASNYCGTSGASNIISVTADHKPPAPILSALGSTILCNGAETILSSTGTGVQWYRNGSILYGATGSYYAARLAGNYTAVSINSCGTSPASNIISITIEAAPPAPVISTTGTTLLCNGANIILSSTGSNIQWYRNDVIISGATSTTYTASVAGNYSSRSSNNCGTSQASNIVVINTSETPTAPIIAAYGNTTFCEGGGVNLTATGSGIKWYKNLVAIPDATGPSYFATSTGKYTATSANSCGISPQSSGILVTMESVVPRIPVITAHGSVTFCTGGSVLLSTTGSGIQWYKDGLAIAGATATNYAATISGSYTVTSINSCGQSPVSVAIVVTSESGIPAAPVITSSGSTSICDGSSVTLSSNTIVSWYHNGSLVGNGNTFAATLRGIYTARAMNSCGVSKASNAVSVTINPMLRVKTSRFDQVIAQTSNQEIPDTAAIATSTAAHLNDHVNSVCEGYADQWMSELAAGLESYPQAMRDTLRIKLIEICTAGGDMSHPFGASTLPPGRVSASGYSSFAEAMKDVLGLNTFTASLNPWLLSSPYPYSPAMQATEKYLSTTDSTLCARLQQLQTEHQAGQPGATFYQYLKNQYGAAMNITSAQLDILVKSCASCNYILERDIPLPVFIEPGAKGCITASKYNTARLALSNEFAEGLPDNILNYENIVTNYLNQSWGFTLSYDKYKKFENQIVTNPSAILCNQPVYESIDADPYAEVKNMIAIAVANGKRDYAAYITEERRKFVQAYIDTCSAAKASVDLTKEEQVYHYTLYYYDQADNLVRTIPPEGVAFLSDNEVALVADYRKKDAPLCNNYDGPVSNSDKTVALQKLSDILAADTIYAIEMWLYNPNNNNGGQVIATTPDRKFMFQTCINGNQLDVNIYTLEPDTISGAISFISSHHAMADLTATPSLSAWTHVVLQSDSVRGGDIQVFVNGKLRPLLPGETESVQSGCGWEINDTQTMPENLSTLKHLRFYDRLLNASEITANASNECFNLDPARKTQLQLNLLAWYRFNTPRAGDLTTVASNTTIETSINPVYPDHGLPTTYAYNSTNQVMMQHTPDGATSRFWYDYLSRLTASQNAKQKAEDKYSYTKYDMLGRITEVGEKTFAASGLSEPAYLDSTAVNIFLAGGANSQITQTLYDSTPVPGNGIQPVLQENLRKRVAVSLYRETDSSSVKQASYYNYDLNGNVKTLYQSVYGLGIKTLNYEYDLVSGKVNFLRYQSGYHDQFYYQYKYDAENRLTEAWSGTKALVRPFGRSYLMDGKLDASYEYYLHGPLARIELGDQYGKVQGMDYAYTLQGWLKGVNGQKLDAATEIGADGEVVAKDALAYSLGYYAGDYKPIGGTGSSAFGMQYQGQVGDIAGQNLYNGNISNTTVAISKFRNGDPVGYTYKYDQLNRLKEMRQHELPGSATSWDATSMVEKYKERISYDGNGNILSFLRNGTTEASKPSAMDNLTYNYSKDGNNRLVNNRLRHVNDAVAGSNYTEDLDDQRDDNYSYDAIGNLVKDTQEEIDSIQWTVYGKIKSINKTNGTHITYNYDPSGNRVSKSVFTPSQGALMTWYIRDAQGNTMGVYDNWNCGINWKEQQLYGSSRLGMWKPNINLNTVTDSSLSVWDTVSKKVYELNNHLGNVLAAISDKRMLVNGTYEAEVLSAQDYYSFGSFQTGRNWTLGDSYRYGFNGKEDDNEVKGVGNSLDFGARIYDSRIDRFLSVDPKAAKMPAWSPYSFGFNNPIHFIDPDGQEPTPAEAARMAAHVYGDKKNSILTGGWRVSSRNFGIQLQTEAGLKSLVYERVVNGKVTEYTYATAGTENGKDWRENGKQPFGLSAQYEQAADNAKILSKALNNTELNFVGHSLGGGEAALNSLVTSDEKLIGRKAFTFNAAGVGDITKFSEGTWKTPFKSESKIDAYILRTDPLNLLQNNSPIMPDVNGNRNYLFPKDLPSTYNGHSIDNIIKNFGVTNPDKYKK